MNQYNCFKNLLAYTTGSVIYKWNIYLRRDFTGEQRTCSYCCSLSHFVRKEELTLLYVIRSQWINNFYNRGNKTEESASINLFFRTTVLNPLDANYIKRNAIKFVTHSNYNGTTFVSNCNVFFVQKLIFSTKFELIS